MMEDIINIYLYLKIKLLNVKTNVFPRVKLSGTLKKFQEDKSETMFVKDERRYQTEVEISVGGKFIEEFKLNNSRQGNMYNHVTVRSKRAVGDLK